jgi:hypothetical protein
MRDWWRVPLIMTVCYAFGYWRASSSDFPWWASIGTWAVGAFGAFQLFSWLTRREIERRWEDGPDAASSSDDDLD